MGFKEAMIDTFSDVLTYRTVKLVKTKDKLLVAMHFTFMTVIVVFTFLSIVVFRNYMRFEAPSVAVSTGLDTSDYYNRNVTAQTYCSGAGRVDFTEKYGSFETYTDPQCVNSLSLSEFTKAGTDGFWFYTHFVQRTITRNCDGRNAVTFAECTETVNSTVHSFVEGVEELKIKFVPTYLTTWGLNTQPHEVIVDYGPGKGKEIFNKGVTPTVKLKDILKLVHANLDDNNPGVVGTGKSSPYRVTGVRLKLLVKLSNINYYKPFDSRARAQIFVEKLKNSFFYGPPVEVIYRGGSGASTLQSHDEVRVERQWHGVSVEFSPSGYIGTVDLYQTMLAITNAFVLIGMATFMVDFLGLFLSETFYDDKYEDDSERKGLEGMLECMESKETPRVPFNPRDLRLVDDDNEPGISYENAIYSLMSKVSDVEDRLSLIPEEEPDFRVGEAKAPEVPRLRLVEVMPEYEEGLEPEEGVPDPHMIQLYSGVQMMGRGQGGVESKAVSRQQLSLTVVKDKVRIKAQRDGPGYMKMSDEVWEPLKMNKAAVLQVGDQICFRMREGKQGGHMGVFSIDFESPYGAFSFFGC